MLLVLASLELEKSRLQEIEETDAKVGKKGYTGWTTNMNPLAE